MKQKFNFGKLNVTCEGYRHQHDRYVLKDSCALEFELKPPLALTSEPLKFYFTAFCVMLIIFFIWVQAVTLKKDEFWRFMIEIFFRLLGDILCKLAKSSVEGDAKSSVEGVAKSVSR